MTPRLNIIADAFGGPIRVLSVAPIFNQARTSFLRQMSGGVAAKIAGAVLSFLLSVVLARTLGPDDFGIYSFAIAIMTVALVPAQLGLPSLVVRETASFHATGDWIGISKLWRWSIRAALLTASLTTLLAVICSFAFGGPFIAVLVVAALTILPATLNSLRASMLRGIGRVAVGVMPEYMVRPALLIIFALGAQSLFDLASSGAMALNVLACFSSYFVGWVILKKCTPTAAWGSGGHVALIQRRDWLHATIWLSLLASSQVISQQIDIILVTLLLDPAQAGSFRVAMAAAAVIVFGLNAVNLVVAPYFSRLLAQNRLGEVQRIVTQSSRLTLAFALPICLLFFFASDKIVESVYGAGFESAGACIRILCIGQIVNASFGAVSGLMTMARQQQAVVKVFTVAMTVGAIASVSLIPFMGVSGAAVGSSLSLVIWNITLAIVAYRRFGIWCFAVPKP